MELVKRDQCCKCRWTGEHSEKSKRKDWDSDIEIYVTTDICPECGHEDFYDATERQYQNHLKRSQK